MSSEQDIRRLPNRQAMFEAVADYLKPVIIDTLERATKSCCTCDNFDQVNEVCKIANPPQRPPARVIAFGCPAYQDEVPF